MTFFRASIPIQDASAERDPTIYCVQLEGWFLTSLLGLVSAIAIDPAWEGTEEERSLAIDAVEEQMLQLMGVLACDGVASISTAKSGYMKATYTSGNETIIANTYTAADILNMPEEQETDNTSDQVCAGVRFLSARFWDDVLYSLDQAQFAIDEAKLAAELLSTILTTVPFFGATAGVAYDGWEELIAGAFTLGVSALKLAFSDPAVQSKFQENLYCSIINSDVNTLTEEMFFAATEDLPLLEEQSSFLADFMRSFNVLATGEIFQTVLRFYNMGALSEDPTCAAEYTCPDEWCYTIDFKESDGSFIVDATYVGAVWGDGIGWVAGDDLTSGEARRCAILNRTIASSTITEVSIVYDIIKGTYQNPPITAIFAGSGAPSALNIGFNTGITDGTDKVWTWNGSQAGCTSIRIGVVTSYDVTAPLVYSGAAAITRVTIKGTGSNPFGAGNC